MVGGPRSHGGDELERYGVDLRTLLLVDTRAEGMDVSSITVDNVEGGYIGAKYLIGLGRRNITYIASKSKTFDMEDRLRGVQRAIHESGVRDRFRIVETGPGEQEGYEITKRILTDTEVPVAIFAVNDVTALGALRACADRGLRIPEEAAVLGFDDLSMAQYLSPRLSTIHQPRLQMGREGAVRLLELVDRAERGDPPGHVSRVLPPRLVLRESA
jgi:DNA-binding LacI/PurR family transcriptional regulator